MAKTKHDFVQLTKSYCKQNKTFLDNTTVTDYLGGNLRLDTNRLTAVRWREGEDGRQVREPGAERRPREGRPLASSWTNRTRWTMARAKCPIGQSPGTTKANHPAGQSMSASEAGRPIRAAEGRDKGRSSQARERGAGGSCGPRPAAGASRFSYPPASFHSVVS